MASGTGSPCGACKFLRRKCAAGCVFAPYFCSEQGPAQFAAVHRVFGASNASKLLMHVPPPDRCEAAVTLAYEAQARIRDPVYGCVAHIFALQQQVASLQVQLMLAKAELAHKTANYSPSVLEDRDWQGNLATPLPQSYLHGHYSLSPQSSLDCIDHSLDTNSSTEDYLEEHSDLMHPCLEEGGQQCDLGELHDLALRMIRN